MGVTFCPNCMSDIDTSAQVCPVCGFRPDSYYSDPDRSAVALSAGTVLNGQRYKYIIGKYLGIGGFGITYIAKQLGTGRVVAIKEYFNRACNCIRKDEREVVPTQNMESFDHSLNSFVGEATMLLGFSHLKNIVHVLEFFKANGTAYMVMEFVDGVTLRNYISANGAMDFESQVLPMFRPLLEDLNYLHESDVIHRDIAPDNIMVLSDGSVKLIDFGCARSTTAKKLTELLKPGFAPYEQRGTGGQGSWTDVYAMCATIYYCVTGGKVPADSNNRIYETKLNGTDPLIPPSSLGGKITSQSEQVLMHGLALMAEDRIKTMPELLAEFDKAAPPVTPVTPVTSVTPVSPVPQVTNFAPGVNPPQADTLKVIIGILVAIVVVLVLLVFVMAQNQDAARFVDGLEFHEKTLGVVNYILTELW